jgi:DNA-binding CsgD family transcriptional regulator
MFDPIAPAAAHAAPRPRLHDSARVAATPAAMPNCYALMLDEVDYGMLLVADDMLVLHANHVARAELDAEHPLQLLGAALRVRHPQDVAPLREALAAARERGLRRLLSLGAGEHRLSLAVVPLPAAAGDETLTLLMFGKRRVCETLSTHWFAREHGLTPAEARVLTGLCDGQPPVQIARQQGVAISTVRAQIGAIRIKTGSASISALVRQLAVLPPLVGVLRTGAMGTNAMGSSAMN